MEGGDVRGRAYDAKARIILAQSAARFAAGGVPSFIFIDSVSPFSQVMFNVVPSLISSALNRPLISPCGRRCAGCESNALTRSRLMNFVAEGFALSAGDLPLRRRHDEQCALDGGGAYGERGGTYQCSDLRSGSIHMKESFARKSLLNFFFTFSATQGARGVSKRHSDEATQR